MDSRVDSVKFLLMNIKVKKVNADAKLKEIEEARKPIQDQIAELEKQDMELYQKYSQQERICCKIDDDISLVENAREKT